MPIRSIIGFILFLATLSMNAQHLQDTIITLEGIEVKESAIKPLHPLTIVENRMIERTAVADMGEILRSQPNVSGIRRGGYAIDPVVRGFRYSQINIFLDEGVHIEGGCPNRMDPVLAHIKSEDIQRLEIAHGPYLLKYGPTLGSSLKVVTLQDEPFVQRKLKATSISSFDANRNGVRQHVAIENSRRNFYYRVSGGYANYGNYTDGRGREWETSFKKYGVSADIGFSPYAYRRWDVSYKGSFARDVLFPALPMDETADNTNIISVVYTHINPSRLDDLTKISAYFSSVYHEMDNSRRPQYSSVVPPWQGIMQAVAKVNTRSAGTRITNQHMHRGMRLEGGFDLNHTWKDGNRFTKMIMEMDGQEFINERTVGLWKNATAVNSGLFASISARQRNFEFATTLRTDLSYSTSGDTIFIKNNERIYYDAKPSMHVFWSLGLNMAYHFTEEWRIAVGLGRGVRPPDLSERYIQFLATGFDRYDYLGNPDLKPELNYQADLIIEFKDDRFHVFTNLFRADVQNYIYGKLLPPAVARPQSMGAPGVKQFQNVNRAVLYGFETGLIAKPVPDFTFNLTAGYTYAYFPKIEKIILENAQAIGTQIIFNDPVPEIPALESVLRINYEFKRLNLEPSVEIRAVAAQNQVSEASYEDSTPGFVIAGVGLGWKPLKKVHFNAGISNLFNKAYYEHLNRRIIGSGGNFYEPGRAVWVNLRFSIP